MNIAHPTLQARDIATLIDNDPIMASQIKEYIKPERLIELLELVANPNDEGIIALIKERKLVPVVLEEASDHDLLDEVRNRM